jgi:hypoxanthine phosphoribosyltransferase
VSAPKPSAASRATLGRVVVSQQQIAARVPELARQIVEAAGPGDDEILLVAVMTGAFIFAADLVRAMHAPLRVSSVAISSYPGAATSSQGVRLLGELPSDIEGRRVVVVDDVLDSGRTVAYLREQFMARRPRWFAAAVLLRKPVASALSTPCEFVGFDIPDEFVVGYGLDFDGCYRHLPEVRVLHPEARA